MKRIAALCLAALLLCQPVLAARRTDGFDNFTRSRTYDGQFEDVPEDSWYYDSVADAYELGLMDGTGSAAFSPEDSLSAAEMLTLACRLLSIYTGDGAEFAESSPWYTSYVNYAAEQGMIVRGQFPDYTLPATRAETAAVLGLLPTDMLAPINEVQNNAIPDVAPGSAYYAEVYRLYRAGILTGSGPQSAFLPDATITRGEAAAIAVRLAVPSARKSMKLQIQPVTLYADDSSRITVDPGQAAAYEIQGWQRAPFTVSPSQTAEEILNAATLRVKLTGTQALDSAVADIFDSILTDSMSTYEKVKACYDYLIGHLSAGSAQRVSGRGDYQNAGDYALAVRAQGVLESGTGSSEDYAAAFLVMARRIGLNCYTVSGEAVKSGDWADHTWNIITVGGTDYVFDVFMEDGLSGARVQYLRFCKTFEQLSQSYRNYDAESAKSGFGNFAR